jgi:hypothetical protein
MVFITALSGSQNIPPALPEVTECDGDRFFVDIHADKFYSVHDLPPWLWLCVKG